MNFDVDVIVEKIKQNKDFLKLKEVIENNAYHHNESVYDHLVKTYGIAKEQINVDLITNPESRSLFESYVSVEIEGIRKKDLMMIFSLIHDIGKLKVKTEIQSDGTTRLPNHEYEGSLIVGDVVEGFPDIILKYLANCVRLHGLFNNTWNENPNSSAEEFISIIKPKSEGILVELIFNSYCDCYTAKPFQPAIPLIHEIFNLPKTFEA